MGGACCYPPNGQKNEDLDMRNMRDKKDNKKGKSKLEENAFRA